jgi:hypothetical protein
MEMPQSPNFIAGGPGFNLCSDRGKYSFSDLKKTTKFTGFLKPHNMDNKWMSTYPIQEQKHKL